MRALILAAIALASCATTPEGVLAQLDAESDREVEASTARCARLVSDRTKSPAVRASAAKVIARLGTTSPEVIASLGRALADESEPDEVRVFAAWALGELRSEGALAELTRALRTQLAERCGERVLEGIAKHDAIIARDPDRFVEIVESMVYFAANQPGGAPPLYDLLGARTRTVPVSVRVLDRAIDRATKSGSNADHGAAYQAVFDLLFRLEGSRSEIAATPDAWRARIAEAARAARRALTIGDERTAVLVLWYLARLADSPEIALPISEALVGARSELGDRPTRSKDRTLRFIAAWAVARMQLHALGARRALLLDVLASRVEPEVLRMIGDLSSREEEHDLVQKLSGVE
jgi:hypothetical protein